MKFYCGIDLGARNSQVCMIDDDLNIHLQQKIPNDLPRIIHKIDPFNEDLRIVVESTFNWYWLIDGLQEKGYDVFLAHTLGLYMITGAKVKTDRRDALALAKLLKAGLIPKAYIYPKHSRPVRDLLRRRRHLVSLRAIEYSSLRMLLMRHGILEHNRNQIKLLPEEELKRWLSHPLVQLHARQQLQRARLYTSQLEELEEKILTIAQDRPEYDRLMTIPGIGKILAVTVLYEVGEISRFLNPKHFSSYCRLIPGITQSGSSCRRGRGSKQGNANLKWAFSQAAIYAVRYYPKIRRSYDRHLRRHQGRARKLIAYNIIAHKLAVAAFHVLRNETVYHEEMLLGS